MSQTNKKKKQKGKYTASNNPNRHSEKWLDMAYTSGNEWVNRRLKKAFAMGVDNVELEMQDRELSYITNFYSFDNEEFQKIWPYIAKELYLTGYAGVQYAGGKFLVYTIAQVQENLQHEIIEADGIITVMGQTKNAKLTSKDSALVRASIWGKPWFLFSQAYIERHIQALELLTINLENAQTTRLIQVNRATNEREAEIKEKYYSGRPYVVVQGMIEKTEDIGLKNQQKDLWENIWENIKMWEKYRSIRHNPSKKDAERNTVAELKNDDIQFTFIEIDRKRIIDDMLNQLKKVAGVEITCKTLIEVEQEKAEEAAKKEGANNETQGEM